MRPKWNFPETFSFFKWNFLFVNKKRQRGYSEVAYALGELENNDDEEILKGYKSGREEEK